MSRCCRSRESILSARCLDGRNTKFVCLLIGILYVVTSFSRVVFSLELSELLILPMMFVVFIACDAQHKILLPSIKLSNSCSMLARWPMRGFFKLITMGNEVRYGIEFSVEDVQQLC